MQGAVSEMDKISGVVAPSTLHKENHNAIIIIYYDINHYYYVTGVITLYSHSITWLCVLSNVLLSVQMICTEQDLVLF